MNFVSARRKKGKVKYTKILKKGALGEFKLGYKFACLHIQWLELRNEHLKKYVCIFILTFVIATIFLFLKIEAHYEGRAQSKPLNSL